MMSLRRLEAALAQVRAQGATDLSRVVIEGIFEEKGAIDDGSLLQAGVGTVTVESRCEEGPPSVYLNLVEMNVG